MVPRALPTLWCKPHISVHTYWQNPVKLATHNVSWTSASRLWGDPKWCAHSLAIPVLVCVPCKRGHHVACAPHRAKQLLHMQVRSMAAPSPCQVAHVVNVQGMLVEAGGTNASRQGARARWLDGALPFLRLSACQGSRCLDQAQHFALCSQRAVPRMKQGHVSQAPQLAAHRVVPLQAGRRAGVWVEGQVGEDQRPLARCGGVLRCDV